MNRQILSIAILLMMGALGLQYPWADTIFFKDGTSIDCLYNEEKKKFKEEEYQDPNFIEIEIFGGYVGFWDRGQVERIEKNDNYVPPTDETQAFMRELIQKNQLILPTAMVEGGFVLPGELEKPIAGRVTQSKNWAFVHERGLTQKMRLQEGREFRADQMISTARNSRLKFSIGPIVTGGLGGGTTLQIVRLNHAEHVSSYELGFQLEQGQLWLEIRRRVLEGGVLEKISLQINDCRFVANEGLFHFQVLPEQQLRITQLAGTEVRVSVKGNPAEAQLEPGKAIRVPLQGEKVITEEAADKRLANTWATWDAWQPEEISVPITVTPGEPESAPLMRELSAFAEGPTARESALMVELLTDPLPTILKKYRAALEIYKEKNGDYPDPAEGLGVLHQDGDKDPYGVRNLPLEDPWGRPLAYDIMQMQLGKEPVQIVSVRSFGPNGVDEKGLGDDIQ